MKANELGDTSVMACLQDFRAEEMIPTTDDTLRKVVAIEAGGGIVDFMSGDIFDPSDDWRSFVNFWMDMMWSLKRQRNYVKLALVMRSIHLRDMQMDRPLFQDFDYWCHQAMLYQSIYFLRENICGK